MLLDKHSKPPERRQLNLRWFFCSILVGMTSFLLMGGALYIALEGREQLTTTAQAYQRSSDSTELSLAPRGNHPGIRAKTGDQSTNVMMVSTISQVEGKNVVKVRPFLNVVGKMAESPRPTDKYPAFNALNVFSDSGDAEIYSEASDYMYGADVEGEVTLNVVDFPYEAAYANSKPRQHTTEIFQQILNISDNLESGGSRVSALAYFDSERFSQTDHLLFGRSNISITPENVTVMNKIESDADEKVRYEDRLIKVNEKAAISVLFEKEGINKEESTVLTKILGSDLGSNELNAGDRMQVWLQLTRQSDDSIIYSVASVSIYRGPSHLVSIARNDDGQFVYASIPDSPDEVLNAKVDIPIINTGNLPSVYDGIYRTAINKGLGKELAASLIRIFAFDVDFRSRISPEDELDVFVSLEDGQEKPTEQSEILYAGLKLGDTKRRYYRYRDKETGRVDYYDETGKSAKKFLLRQPVPNGKFRSAFGMRRHPISGRYKLHGGVDWSAPRGTPILAAGNGVVEKAKWAGGNGKRTIIRHANGYETYYLHQTAFAKGIRPGARVRQGQIIGYVGSTGYSTGPHLHYEVHVNGKRVDPMRIRLPKGKVLRGEELADFEAERNRIDDLLNSGDETEVATN